MALKVDLTVNGITVPNAYVRAEPRGIAKTVMTFAAVAYVRNPTSGPTALAAQTAPVDPGEDATGDQKAAYETASAAYVAAEKAAEDDLALQPFSVGECFCAYDMNGANPWMQAYDYLLTLDAYKGATRA